MAPISHVRPNLPRAWYSAPVRDFLAAHPSEILGALAANGEFALLPGQRDAWIAQIPILQNALAGLEGVLCLEFTIPRVGHRADAVLLVGPALFVLEFKVGEREFRNSDRDQVWDYALDLKHFHAASHHLPIVPLLIATAAEGARVPALVADPDRVYRPLELAPAAVRPAIAACLAETHGSPIDCDAWLRAPYQPTPTIIEAARVLYARHSVEAITRSDAAAINLTATTERVLAIVRDARARGRKAICFVTGVPGAGKTLVGLNISTKRLDNADQDHAVFLSGNGPLVAVLGEALARDELGRLNRAGENVRKGEVRARVKKFIQNVHHFRDEGLRHEGPPSEHVVIFDEAQRAWNLKKDARLHGAP